MPQCTEAVCGFVKKGNRANTLNAVPNPDAQFIGSIRRTVHRCYLCFLFHAIPHKSYLYRCTVMAAYCLQKSFFIGHCFTIHRLNQISRLQDTFAGLCFVSFRILYKTGSQHQQAICVHLHTNSTPAGNESCIWQHIG